MRFGRVKWAYMILGRDCDWWTGICIGMWIGLGIGINGVDWDGRGVVDREDG